MFAFTPPQAGSPQPLHRMQVNHQISADSTLPALIPNTWRGVQPHPLRRISGHCRVGTQDGATISRYEHCQSRLSLRATECRFCQRATQREARRRAFQARPIVDRAKCRRRILQTHAPAKPEDRQILWVCPRHRARASIIRPLLRPRPGETQSIARPNRALPV